MSAFYDHLLVIRRHAQNQWILVWLTHIVIILLYSTCMGCARAKTSHFIVFYLNIAQNQIRIMYNLYSNSSFI